MKTVTVEELCVLCYEETKKGNGKKKILISDDDEGNGYHHLLYHFSNAKGLINNKEDEYTIWVYGVDNPDDYIILG